MDWCHLDCGRPSSSPWRLTLSVMDRAHSVRLIRPDPPEGRQERHVVDDLEAAGDPEGEP